jgi:hypothetical protein
VKDIGVKGALGWSVKTTQSFGRVRKADVYTKCNPSFFKNIISMMNFYYDPILGLQYDYLGELFNINLVNIPKDFNLDEFIKEWRRFASMSIMLIQYSSIEIVGQITQYKL